MLKLLVTGTHVIAKSTNENTYKQITDSPICTYYEARISLRKVGTYLLHNGAPHV